ncbi:hypothetical protein AB0F81_03620 [Actinoplanes sp. NPDC024001]|uniref:hypothetical protein n=1 Tax=Actinoplanes sp. NPDC024001 TaxID=3154598 RepID=UPI00340CEC52
MTEPEPATCGQGLVANAGLPAALGRVAATMADVLERHMASLDQGDPRSAAEHAVYGELATGHRRAAEQLLAAGERMAAQQELPMGPHDMEVLTDPATMQAFQDLVVAKRHLLGLLRDGVDEDDAMLAMMRDEA